MELVKVDLEIVCIRTIMVSITRSYFLKDLIKVKLLNNLKKQFLKRTIQK